MVEDASQHPYEPLDPPFLLLCQLGWAAFGEYAAEVDPALLKLASELILGLWADFAETFLFESLLFRLPYLHRWPKVSRGRRWLEISSCVWSQLVPIASWAHLTKTGLGCGTSNSILGCTAFRHWMNDKLHLRILIGWVSRFFFLFLLYIRIKSFNLSRSVLWLHWFFAVFFGWLWWLLLLHDDLSWSKFYLLLKPLYD